MLLPPKQHQLAVIRKLLYIAQAGTAAPHLSAHSAKASAGCEPQAVVAATNFNFVANFVTAGNFDFAFFSFANFVTAANFDLLFFASRMGATGGAKPEANSYR